MHGNTGVYRLLGYFNFLSYLKKKKKTAQSRIHVRVGFFWDLCKNSVAVRGGSVGCSGVRQGTAAQWGQVSQLPVKLPSLRIFPTVLTTLWICFPSRYMGISCSCLSSFLMHG